MPVQLHIECDNCGRSSLRYTYWRCNHCGKIACDNCADEQGTKVGMRTIGQSEGLLQSFGKGVLAGLMRACPNCNDTPMTIIYKP